MMKKIVLLVIVSVSLSIIAQKPAIDSLKNTIKTTKEDTIRISALNKLTEIEWHKSNYLTALKYAGMARDLSLAINYKQGAIKALNNAGLISMAQGNHPDALENLFHARKLNLDLKQPAEGARILNNIGAVFWNKADYAKALDYFSQSLEIYKSLNDSAGLSNNYNNIGIIYAETGKDDKALEYYFKALAIIEKLKAKEDQANTLNNICNVYWGQNKIEDALKYQFQALELRKTLGDKDGVAISLVNLGGIYLDKKEYPKAINYLKQAIQHGSVIGNPAIVKESEMFLVNAYEQTNDPVNAYFHYKRFIACRDSLFNEEKTKDMVRTEMNFEFDLKQQTAKLEQEKKEAVSAEALKRQTLTTYVFAGSSLLVLLLALAISRGYHLKRKANLMLHEQKKIIEEKNKDITDSINYAKQIQQAILPFEERFRNAFGQDYFIHFKPRDIVSGDFYWFTEKDERIFLAVVDCTGHGVPGAFMSMVGSAALSNIVNEKGITAPHKILEQLDTDIRKSLNQESGSNRDGMDMVLCVIDKSKHSLQFAGAMNSLYYFKGNELIELKGDKYCIGGLHEAEEERKFTLHTIDLNQPVSIYLSTDGYSDQFGGQVGKKFKSSNFKKLLASIQNKSMHGQKESLDTTFENWRGNLEQVDDVCIVGVRIG